MKTPIFWVHFVFWVKTWQKQPASGGVLLFEELKSVLQYYCCVGACLWTGDSWFVLLQSHVCCIIRTWVGYPGWVVCACVYVYSSLSRLVQRAVWLRLHNQTWATPRQHLTMTTSSSIFHQLTLFLYMGGSMVPARIATK